MRICDHFKQGTREWAQAHIGRIGSTQLITVLRGRTKAWERLSNGLQKRDVSQYTSRLPSIPSLRWGVEHEAEARRVYTTRTRLKVREIGCVIGTDTRYCVSPDGLVQHDGLIEIKCPYVTANHIAVRKSRAVPEAYRAQVYGMMWVTERKWCDFVSYDPRHPMSLIIVRVYQDANVVALLEARAKAFWAFHRARTTQRARVARAPVLFGARKI